MHAVVHSIISVYNQTQENNYRNTGKQSQQIQVTVYLLTKIVIREVQLANIAKAADQIFLRN